LQAWLYGWRGSSSKSARTNTAQGLLSTAGGLIFAGCNEGIFTALDAKTGAPLWHFNTGQAIAASPITYKASRAGSTLAVEAGSYVCGFWSVRRTETRRPLDRQPRFDLLLAEQVPSSSSVSKVGLLPLP